MKCNYHDNLDSFCYECKQNITQIELGKCIIKWFENDYYLEEDTITRILESIHTLVIERNHEVYDHYFIRVGNGLRKYSKEFLYSKRGLSI